MDEPVLRVISPNGPGPSSGPGRRGSVHRQLQVVVPLWNEEQIVVELHRRLTEACRKTGLTWEIVYVDDGSTDATSGLLAEFVERGEPVQVVALSRNFGQPAAIHAGLAASTAERVVLLDGDLQDPPELIPELADAFASGAEVVIARRRSRKESSRLRRFFFSQFHRWFAALSDLGIPSHCGTYSLLSRKAVDAILSLPESHRFFPGLRAWIGFRQEMVDYDRDHRAAGTPKQTLRRLFRYAGDAIFGYSARPVVWLGWGAAALAGLAGGALLAAAVSALSPVAWWVPVCLLISGLMSGFCALQMVAMAYIAELVRRTYDQSKQRPQYLIGAHLVGSSRSWANEQGETEIRQNHAA